MPPNSLRLLRALAREGLQVRRDGPLYIVKLASTPDAPEAEVLLPDSLPVEAEALCQLARLAALRHPNGGEVVRAFATPDFHPGDGGVAIGSIVETRGLVIPGAVGTDINCGMRLHVADLNIDQFRARRDVFVERMKGDLFGGGRDLPQDGPTARALFTAGLGTWLGRVRAHPRGQMASSDGGQLEREVEQVYRRGELPGAACWAPAGLLPDAGVVRDPGLATVGGGNHFVEIQVVDALLDRGLAYAWGVRAGQLAVMVHSGSRDVGRHVGFTWRERARAAWPSGVPFPEGGLLPISEASHPELVAEYLEAEATAANYGFANRLLLAELVRLRLREVFGDLEMPLVYDLPHNLTFQEGGRHVVRKGACPAHAGQPVIIPGSMGDSSFLLVGCGNERFLSSASHGAGRSRSRFEMSRGGAAKDEDSLGLRGVDCVTPRAERRIEEAPAAYKPIAPVIDAQVAAGMVKPVARMRPVLTFKA